MSNPVDAESQGSSQRRRSGSVGVLGDEAASLVRRFCAVLVGVWLGAVLMLVLTAPAAFRSVDTALKTPPPALTKVLKVLGEDAVREVLRYQVGEANRLMFESWGLLQLALGGLLFFLLLFFTTVRRPTLGISAGMLVMSAVIHFFLIPQIVQTGRLMYGSQASTARSQFGALHVAFSTFEAAVALLGVLLLVLLLRRRGGRGSRRSESWE